jgi:formylglycine-generating enzyme required for sulfatase activity
MSMDIRPGQDTMCIRLMLFFNAFFTASLTMSPAWPFEAKPLPKHARNSIGMEFVLVPAGQFMMGNDESAESLASSYPQYSRERLMMLQDEAPVCTRCTSPMLSISVNTR